MTPQQLSERLWQFAARIAKVVDALPETRVGRHVAGQIVRSGIAAAPNPNDQFSIERSENLKRFSANRSHQKCEMPQSGATLSSRWCFSI
jgi:hypothetical protein